MKTGYRSKFSFADTLTLINEGRHVSADQIKASALKRKVWVAEWHLPGCLSESRAYCLTKADAIDSACSMAEGEDGIPRGMKTSLRKYGRFDSDSPMFGRCINTVECHTLADLL